MVPRGAGESEDDPSLAPEPQSVLGEARPFELSELVALFQNNPDGLSSAATRHEHPHGFQLSTAVERWVRKVALGGDARRGVAKLDIGAGRYAGTELVVVAEAGRVAVELNIPQVTDPSLAERLRSRLERRGYSTEVTVR